MVSTFLQITKRDNALQAAAGDGYPDRQRTRRNQKSIVGRLHAFAGSHAATHAIDMRHGILAMQGNPMRGVPLRRVSDDVLDTLLAGQQG